MFNFLKKTFLLALAASWAASASSPQKGLFPMILVRHACGNAHVIQRPKALAKATAAAFSWQQIGSTHYQNTNYYGDSVTWTFSSRDTFVFDTSGNKILSKTSSAHTGWSSDSLTWLDSSIYNNGRITEEIYKSFYSSSTYGDRYTFAYFNGGKVIVETVDNWNDSIKNWVPADKDSLIFSAAVDINSIDMFSYLVGECMRSFDTLSSSWKNMGCITKIDSESNATTLVMGGRVSLYGADSMDDIKIIMTFAGTHWVINNMTEEREQKKNPSTGTYYDIFKFDYTYNPKGNRTSQQTFYWDSTTQSLVNEEKDLMFPDSFGNDTLELDYYYNTVTLAWDTNSINRSTRSYDANGNNIKTIQSSFDTYTMTWQVESEDINVFSQIKLQVIQRAASASIHKIAVTKTATSVRFSAQGITSLRLYDVSGRLVSSIDQKAAPSISLGFSNRGVPIPAGTYIVKIMRQGEEMNLKLLVQR